MTFSEIKYSNDMNFTNNIITSDLIKNTDFNPNNIYMCLPDIYDNKSKHYLNIQNIIFDIFEKNGIVSNENEEIKKKEDLKKLLKYSPNLSQIRVIYGLISNNNINEDESELLKTLIDKEAHITIFKFKNLHTMEDINTELILDELHSINISNFYVDSYNELNTLDKNYKNELDDAAFSLKIIKFNDVLFSCDISCSHYW